MTDPQQWQAIWDSIMEFLTAERFGQIINIVLVLGLLGYIRTKDRLIAAQRDLIKAYEDALEEICPGWREHVDVEN